ncbi:inositol monophosphatase [Terrihabitans soli]|uniref:Inositol-1-monophosphatase n=1 Tax=Terrihabitans soli TaxID=708113 RepID=A0A6S6QS43_9HYPH|nr:inositol monophosphatase [Terrihabitans soli]
MMNVMIQAATKAGRGMRRDFGEVEQLQVSIKGPSDFVSAADRKAEEILVKELQKARPEIGFLLEEGGAVAGSDASQRFIIDPLDGTTNFLHGIPQFAVSVALEKNSQLIAAVVYNPVNDELFTAERGQGAFLNDRRIRVAARQRLNDCVIGTGVTHRGKGDHDLFGRELKSVQTEVAGIRRMGAASLDLAYLAAGRLDGFWERDLKPWDIAAGILLIREAGGYVTDLNGRDDMFEHGHLCAGNETIHKALLERLKKA